MIKRKAILLTLLCLLLFLTACSGKEKEHMDYLVLLGEEPSHIEAFPDCDVLVIDGEYFSAEDVKYLRAKGVKKIYSYFNIGSLENFRDYYDTFSESTLGEYENWPEEKWMDVSDESWQRFLLESAEQIAQKGFDGFFVDNTDVYYQYPSDEIYQGILNILTDLHGLEKDIIINGGDCFVKEYLESGDVIDGMITGINQEEVYTCYDFAQNRCGLQNQDTRDYLLEYLELAEQNGIKIYVLEYAKERKLTEGAEAYAREHGWTCYVADHIELRLHE